MQISDVEASRVWQGPSRRLRLTRRQGIGSTGFKFQVYSDVPETARFEIKKRSRVKCAMTDVLVRREIH